MTPFVELIEIRLHLGDVQDLKGKRKLVKSLKDGIRQRLTDSVELALKLAEGLVRIGVASGEEMLLSERFACVSCGISLPEITPRMFSFNSPQGACPRCSGIGEVWFYDPDRIVPDHSLSIADGAIAPWGKAGSPYHRYLSEVLARKVKVAQDVPWKKLPEKKRGSLIWAIIGIILWMVPCYVLLSQNLWVIASQAFPWCGIGLFSAIFARRSITSLSGS